jgi:hypothetical protein
MPRRECDMRALISGAVLMAAAVVGFQILTPYVAARSDKAATFSERFAPVLDQMKKPAAVTSTG